MKAITASLIPCILLSACGAEEVTDFPASGAKSAVSVMHLLARKGVKGNRPSAPLGVFVSVFTSQGTILPVRGAMLGMDTISGIIEGQSTPTSDENFALLREIGEVLQVDIVDALNRAPNRSQFLDEYTQSLRNTGIITERKIKELEALYENKGQELRAARKEAKDVKRLLNLALREQQYTEASEYEERYANAESEKAGLEAVTDQIGDMIDRFEALSEVTGTRLQAVENNREILIAGLRVINVPGIADLNILEKGKTWRRRKGGDIFNKK